MGEPGITNGRHYVFGNGATLAGHQCRCDRAGDTLKDGPDFGGDGLAHLRRGADEGIDALIVGGAKNFRAADTESDAAQLAEIRLALKVEGAGSRWRWRRRNDGPDPEPGPGGDIGLLTSQPDADLFRYLVGEKAGNARPFQRDAATAGEDFDLAHPADDGGRADTFNKNGRVYGGGAPLGNPEPGGDHGNGDQQRRRPAAVISVNEVNGVSGQGHHHYRQWTHPQGRFDLELEVDKNSNAEQYWQPQNPSITLFTECLLRGPISGE